METFMNQASQQGLHVVDNENLQGSYDEYEFELSDADVLCNIVDPEETPYLSKYKAREKLESLCNKMDASRTIAMLEKKSSTIKELNWRIAAVRVKLASIAWECEEPHNTQIELDLAIEFYAPQFLAAVTESTSDLENNTTIATDPPEINMSDGNLVADCMKCLNMQGILWNGRGNRRRAFLFLTASNKLYEKHSSLTMHKKARRELEEELTQNMFYLAQAYGLAGDAHLSSFYCHKTLQRQLDAGLNTANASEWCKNCMGMADFYTALQDYRSAGHALSAVGVIFKQYLKYDGEEKGESKISAETKEKISELEADLVRRWIRLDLNILKTAFERRLNEEAAGQGQETEKANGGDSAEISVFNFDACNRKINLSSENNVFVSLAVPHVQLLDPSLIRTFDDARTVYLRCAGRLESSKKTFPLEGHVTDHITLLEEHSKLYHYLCGFETDIQRKIAMELRRADLLKNLPYALNKSAFDTLIKQLCYQLGEIYMNIYELKFNKVISKMQPSMVHEQYMKLSDIEKCNEYSSRGIAFLWKFIDMYAKSNAGPHITMSSCGEEKLDVNFCNLTCRELAAVPLTEPEFSLIPVEEVRLYLNAHFLICRLVSKMISLPSEPASERAGYFVSSLKHYEWLLKFAHKLCDQKQVKIDEVFTDEVNICQDMVGLLPSKINRMHYGGESGLSL